MTIRAALCAFAIVVATPALAANAENPHQNVNKSIDKGGPTGNSQVDNLNRAQLNKAHAPAHAPVGSHKAAKPQP